MSVTKSRPCFSTPQYAPMQAALWKNLRATEMKHPVLTGSINRKYVNLFLRNGRFGVFLCIAGMKISATEYENLGTANAVTNDNGQPILRIQLKAGEVIWCQMPDSLGADEEFLTRIGLNIERMRQKKMLAEKKKLEIA